MYKIYILLCFITIVFLIFFNIQMKYRVSNYFKPNRNGKKGYVYFLEDPESKQIKIGVSVNVERRIKQLNTGNIGCNIILLKKIATTDMHGLENYYHQMFKKYRKSGEWFDKKIKKYIRTIDKYIYVR